MPASLSVRGEIRSLTGLRGVAACYVVLYHYFGVDIRPGYSASNTIRSHGYLAVDLFFVLSGFVMSLTYTSTFYTNMSVQTYLRFVYNRLARVYPLYLVVTLGCLAIGLGSPERVFTGIDVVFNLLLVQAWGLSDSIAGPSWSISTEFCAYLLFPVLMPAVLWASRPISIAAAGAALACLAYLGTLPEVQLHLHSATYGPRHGPLDIYAEGTPYPLVRCLAGFTLGIFACRLRRWQRIAALADIGIVGDGAAVLMFGLLAIPNSDIAVVLASILLVVTLASERSAVSYLLGCPPLHWLGLVSYSLYLLHSPLKEMWLPTVQPWLAAHIPHGGGIAGLILALVALALSAVTYYLIERPARRWARRLAGGRPLPIEAEPSAP